MGIIILENIQHIHVNKTTIERKEIFNEDTKHKTYLFFIITVDN